MLRASNRRTAFGCCTFFSIALFSCLLPGLCERLPFCCSAYAMSQNSSATPDEYPQIDAKDTDRQLSKYFSNSFNRYSDFKPMAKGGVAEIRSCRDNNLGRTVVIKTLHPHLADHEYLRARFLREARVTAQLQHPNTVPVYEIGHDIQRRLYFTMKKVDGETLREALERHGRSEERRVGKEC